MSSLLHTYIVLNHYQHCIIPPHPSHPFVFSVWNQIPCLSFFQAQKHTTTTNIAVRNRNWMLEKHCRPLVPQHPGFLEIPCMKAKICLHQPSTASWFQIRQNNYTNLIVNFCTENLSIKVTVFTTSEHFTRKTFVTDLTFITKVQFFSLNLTV